MSGLKILELIWPDMLANSGGVLPCESCRSLPQGMMGLPVNTGADQGPGCNLVKSSCLAFGAPIYRDLPCCTKEMQ